MELGVFSQVLLRVVCFFCDQRQGPVSDAPLLPVVSTNYGKIEGFGFATSLGFNADVFLGIPYAAPPVNELRFEKPRPPIKWSQTLSAKKYGARCATYPTYDPSESEDCLTLNVIRPTPPQTRQKQLKQAEQVYPVMVFIHGGDFLTGSSADYSYQNIAENLVSRGVVYVSINYRLGAFGFYSTGNDFASGNYGLWDQVQALKFIQEVIPAFGGDPKKVTIFGESAGAGSVSWLTLNPDLKDLFAGAVQQSGSHQAVWANGDTVVESSKEINRLLNCDHVEDLKKCIQQPSTAEVLAAMETLIQPRLLRVDTPAFSYFHPRIDGDFLDAVDFKQAIKAAPKRANFIGVDSQEDIAFAIDRTPKNTSTYFPVPYYKINKFREANFTEAVEHVLGTEAAYGSRAKRAAKEIIDFYSRNQDYQRNFFLQTFVQIFSDIHFSVPALREAREKAAAGFAVYFYRYSYVPSEYADPMIAGARHGSEMFSIFGFPPKAHDPEDRKTAHKTFVDLLVSFAKFGKPRTADTSVPPVTADKVPFIDVSGSPQIGRDLWPERVAFWDSQARNFGFDWPSGLSQ